MNTTATSYSEAPAAERLRTTRSSVVTSAAEERSARSILQKNASRNLRRHWLRAARRVAVLVIADLTVFAVLRLIAGGLRSGIGVPAWLAELLNSVLPTGFLGGSQFALVLVFSLAVAGAYGAGDWRRDVTRLLGGSALAAGLTLYHLIWVQNPVLVLAQFALTALVLGTLLTIERVALDRLVRRLSPWAAMRRVVVVLSGNGDWVDPSLNGTRSSLKVVGQVWSGDGADRNGHLPVPALGSMIDEASADTVVVCGPISDDDFAFVVDTALVSGCRLLAASRAPRVGGVEPRGVWVDGNPLVELTAPALKAWQLAAKRAVDFLAAFVGLAVLAPVFAAASIAVRLGSPGPVFFRQWRVGRAGKPFEIYKFRSMVADAEQRLEGLRQDSIYSDNRLFKVVRDPRITRVGAFLRRTSLDELPQLFNVLRGDMSLVGPRPPTLSEVALYEEHHYSRFDVRPGITGPWQVSGRNRITEFEDVMRLENDYIRHWSFLSDCRILVKTIPVVLKMEGAH
jgi:exopolysaccharide biosynthesis polyprenyl glycosylphosphotransferase